MYDQVQYLACPFPFSCAKILSAFKARFPKIRAAPLNGAVDDVQYKLYLCKNVSCKNVSCKNVIN